MYVLGISAYYHDSSVCLLKDGKVIAAVEEERLTRIKHDNAFPSKAISKCLEIADISKDEIDYVAYYEKPLKKFERVIDTFVNTYPFSARAFMEGVPEWLGGKIKVEKTIADTLGIPRNRILFVPHHLSHASSTFYPSKFEEAAIVTIDGVGEYATAGLFYGVKNRIYPVKEIHFPNSLGLLYSTLTSFLGFRVNNDEYKVMGLAAYGKPTYEKEILKLIDTNSDGSFSLSMKYFNFSRGYRMWSRNLENLLGNPRNQNDLINKRHKDIAASLQLVTEKVYFLLLKNLYEITSCNNLCISGGVGLNSLANGKIYDHTKFQNVYILGPAGDGGTSLGAALFVYHAYLGKSPRKTIGSLCLGSKWSNKSIEKIIKMQGLSYKKFRDQKEKTDYTAKLLSKGFVIGWFQGKMEFGPRALGARSILAKPGPRKMKSLVNRIKKREQFRPFAGSVLQTEAHNLFDVPHKNYWSPFMNFVFPAKKEKRKDIEAIVHKDNTCRIQTVNQDNGIYFSLIKSFYKLTGIPCILNTSFNVAGEPIVETPGQAVKDFLKTDIDYLVIEDYLVHKS